MFLLCTCRLYCLLLVHTVVCLQQNREQNIDLWLSRMSRSTQVLKIQQRFKGTLFINIEVDLPWNDQRQDTCAASRSISMSNTLFCPHITNDLTVLSFIFPFLSFCCFQNDPIYWESCRVSRRIFHSILVNINWFTHGWISVSKGKLFPDCFFYCSEERVE